VLAALLAAGGALSSAGSSTAAGPPRSLVADALHALAPARETGIGGHVTVFALATPLAGGDTVEASFGGVPRLRVHTRSWLFWEDLGHGFLFPHPSLLLLLDAHGRVLAERPLEAYPLVDGRPPPFAASAAAYLRATGAL